MSRASSKHRDRLLASASNGFDLAEQAGEIKLWNLKNGREVRSLRGHRYGVWKVAFSPDGKRLAAAGSGRVVRVWDVAGRLAPKAGK